MSHFQREMVNILDILRKQIVIDWEAEIGKGLQGHENAFIVLRAHGFSEISIQSGEYKWIPYADGFTRTLPSPSIPYTHVI